MLEPRCFTIALAFDCELVDDAVGLLCEDDELAGLDFCDIVDFATGVDEILDTFPSALCDELPAIGELRDAVDLTLDDELTKL